jgi:hypothetical protein
VLQLFLDWWIFLSPRFLLALSFSDDLYVGDTFIVAGGLRCCNYFQNGGFFNPRFLFASSFGDVLVT